MITPAVGSRRAACSTLGRVSGAGLQGWTGIGGAIVRPSAGGGADVAYTLSQAQGAALRPAQPTDGRPMPIVASADVAAAAGPGGIVPLDFGTVTLEGRVVAVATRFPTTQDTPGTFVVADVPAWPPGSTPAIRGSAGRRRCGSATTAARSRRPSSPRSPGRPSTPCR